MAVRILCLGYACMQPGKSKGLNWPFLHFSGGHSLNATQDSRNGVVWWKTLNKLLASHCLVMPVSCVFVSLSYVALKGSFFV